MLSIAVGILYHWAPNFRAPWRWCFAGGALFSILWIVATWLFALYVANFANYANTYGALGGVIALMLWFYISAFILCAAAALVAATLKELHPTVVAEARVRAGVSAAPLTEDGASDEPDASGDHEATPPRRAAQPSDPDRQRPEPERPKRPRPAFPRTRRAVPEYRMSGPEDWALAGVVTAIGATIGAGVAWLLGTHRRS
jgi:hypothetical protein